MSVWIVYYVQRLKGGDPVQVISVETSELAAKTTIATVNEYETRNGWDHHLAHYLEVKLGLNYLIDSPDGPLFLDMSSRRGDNTGPP